MRGTRTRRDFLRVCITRVYRVCVPAEERVEGLPSVQERPQHPHESLILTQTVDYCLHLTCQQLTRQVGIPVSRCIHSGTAHRDQAFALCRQVFRSLKTTIIGKLIFGT